MLKIFPEKIAAKNHSFLPFRVILRFSYYLGSCKNKSLWKQYSIVSDFARSFSNIYYLTEKFKKIERCPVKFFRSCAYKLVRYLFETLPVATRFIPGPMGFLTDVNLRKCPKTELCGQETRKFGNFGTFVVKFEEHSFKDCVLNILLFQRSGQKGFYSATNFVV